MFLRDKVRPYRTNNLYAVVRREIKNRRNCRLNSSNRTAKANAEPKKTFKNGKVYGNALSAEEKKKIVAQKKKDKK